MSQRVIPDLKMWALGDSATALLDPCISPLCSSRTEQKKRVQRSQPTCSPSPPRGTMAPQQPTLAAPSNPLKVHTSSHRTRSPSPLSNATKKRSQHRREGSWCSSSSLSPLDPPLQEVGNVSASRRTSLSPVKELGLGKLPAGLRGGGGEEGSFVVPANMGNNTGRSARTFVRSLGQEGRLIIYKFLKKNQQDILEDISDQVKDIFSQRFVDRKRKPSRLKPTEKAGLNRIIHRPTASMDFSEATDPTQLLVSLVSDIVEHVERTIIESSVLETLRVSQEKQKQAIHSGLPDSSLSRTGHGDQLGLPLCPLSAREPKSQSARRAQWTSSPRIPEAEIVDLEGSRSVHAHHLDGVAGVSRRAPVSSPQEVALSTVLQKEVSKLKTRLGRRDAEVERLTEEMTSSQRKLKMFAKEAERARSLLVKEILALRMVLYEHGLEGEDIQLTMNMDEEEFQEIQRMVSGSGVQAGIDGSRAILRYKKRVNELELEVEELQDVITNLETQGKKNMEELAEKFSSLLEVTDQDHKDQINNLLTSFQTGHLVSAPEGRIALVFTDVEGSTALWSHCTEAMASALRTHNRCLRDLARKYNLYEVKSEGDGMFLSAQDPVDAVLFCLMAQQELLACKWPQEILDYERTREEKDQNGVVIFRGLRVRMGVHVGEPRCEVDAECSGRMDYFGPVVNMAARVSGGGAGGQILVSQEARDLVLEGLRERFSQTVHFNDLGVFQFKGIPEAVQVFECVSHSLRSRKFGQVRSDAEPKSKPANGPGLIEKFKVEFPKAMETKSVMEGSTARSSISMLSDIGPLNGSNPTEGQKQRMSREWRKKTNALRDLLEDGKDGRLESIRSQITPLIEKLTKELLENNLISLASLNLRRADSIRHLQNLALNNMPMMSGSGPRSDRGMMRRPSLDMQLSQCELPIMEISTPGASYPEEQDQVPPVEEQHAAISTKKVAIESEETQPQKGTPLPPSPPKRAKKKGVQMQDPVEKKKVERPLRKLGSGGKSNSLLDKVKRDMIRHKSRLLGKVALEGEADDMAAGASTTPKEEKPISPEELARMETFERLYRSPTKLHSVPVDRSQNSSGSPSGNPSRLSSPNSPSLHPAVHLAQLDEEEDLMEQLHRDLEREDSWWTKSLDQQRLEEFGFRVADSPGRTPMRPRSSDGHPDSAEEGTLTELRKRPSSSGTTFPSTKFSMASATTPSPVAALSGEGKPTLHQGGVIFDVSSLTTAGSMRSMTTAMRQSTSPSLSRKSSGGFRKAPKGPSPEKASSLGKGTLADILRTTKPAPLPSPSGTLPRLSSGGFRR